VLLQPDLEAALLCLLAQQEVLQVFDRRFQGTTLIFELLLKSHFDRSDGLKWSERVPTRHQVQLLYHQVVQHLLGQPLVGVVNHLLLFLFLF
jgi:hypothetical protein